MEGFAKSLIEKANHHSDEQVHILETVASMISSLHRTSVSIRKAINRNSLAKALDLVDEDEAYDLFGDERVTAVRFRITSAFQRFVEQVLRKRWLVSSLDEGQKGSPSFTEYRDILLGRCAEAIVARRKQLVYLRRHQVRSQERDVTSTDQPTFQRQLGFSLQVPRQTANPLPILPEKTASRVDSAVSELQTASIPSWTPREVVPSLTPSYEGGELLDMGTFELPPPLDSKMGVREKTCPYCCLILPQETYDQRKEYWRLHLLEDLQPYICLFPHCNAGGRTYHTFTEWEMHLKQLHFGAWTCPLQHEEDDDDGTPINGFTYGIEAECEDHLRFEHPELDDDQIRDTLHMAGQQATLPRQCFVCLKEFPDTTDMVVMYKHVASHLEAIFVLALPWVEDIALDNAASSNETNCSTSRDADDLDDIAQLSDIIKPVHSVSTPTTLSKETFADGLAELDTKQNSMGLMNSWMASLSGQHPIEQPSKSGFRADISTADHSDTSAGTQKGRSLIPFTRDKNVIGHELILRQLLQRIPPGTDNDN